MKLINLIKIQYSNKFIYTFSALILLYLSVLHKNSVEIFHTLISTLN